MPAIAGSSTSVSAPEPAGPVVRPPRAGAPGVRLNVTSRAAGSGHSGYGVGFALLQARNTIAPPATRWPAPVATADDSTRCVESRMSVITRVVFVIVPLA